MGLILGYRYQDDPNFFFLDTIVVTKKKKGIGSILLDVLSQWSKFKNLKGIILFTEEFNHKNENLIQFYLKNGFQILTKETDNIIMQKLV